MGCSSFPSGGKNLLDSRFEHESCGVGFVATLHGRSEHEILRLTLTALGRLAHRGAIAADGKSSDGVGIQTAVPRDYLLSQTCMFLRPGQPLAVGMLFFPHDEDVAQRDAQRFKACIYAQGFEWLGWRDVPIAPEVLGEIAAGTMPVIRQALITTADDDFNGEPNELERRLFRARKAFERGGNSTYICSLSTRTLVYKAMCTGRTLQDFYLDLQNKQYTTHFAVFHQRYATNVLPSWDRAQPLRMIAHNGEINTVWSNRAHVDARSKLLPRECEPFYTPDGSDSMSLDEVAELLCNYDRNIAEAVRMMLPPAIGIKESAFHRYHADIMEPWDGPSALVFTDGKLVGAALDRNGLRPCRFVITDTGLVVAGSEVGLADVDTDTIIRSGRLGPGQMILLDLERSRLIEGEELDRYFDDLAPFSELIDDVLLEPASTPADGPGKRRADPPAARLRLHPRRSEDGRHADGDGEQRSRVVHGRRHTHCASRPQPAAALRFLPPAFRAGHQSAHRLAARVLRRVAAHAARPVAAPARQARARARPHLAVAVSHARTNGRAARGHLRHAR